MCNSQVEQLEDPVLPATEVVARVGQKQLMALYKVAAFSSAEQLLQYIALARGKLLKGGIPNTQVILPQIHRSCAMLP